MAFPEYAPTRQLGSAADTRLTRYATGERFVDVYGHPIEGDKQFRADIASALNEITEGRAALSEIAEGKTPPEPHGHYLAHRACVETARKALRASREDDASLETLAPMFGVIAKAEGQSNG